MFGLLRNCLWAQARLENKEPKHCTLQHTATHCNTLQHINVTRLPVCAGVAGKQGAKTLQHTAAYCNTLQYTATLCNTLQHINTTQLPVCADVAGKQGAKTCTIHVWISVERGHRATARCNIELRARLRTLWRRRRRQTSESSYTHVCVCMYLYV